MSAKYFSSDKIMRQQHTSSALVKLLWALPLCIAPVVGAGANTLDLPGVVDAVCPAYAVVAGKSVCIGYKGNDLALTIATDRKGNTVATVQAAETRTKKAARVRLGTRPSDLALAKQSTKFKSMERRDLSQPRNLLVAWAYVPECFEGDDPRKPIAGCDIEVSELLLSNLNASNADVERLLRRAIFSKGIAERASLRAQIIEE